MSDEYVRYILIVLLLVVLLSVVLSAEASAQVREPVFWYRCDCLTCRYLDLQGNYVAVFWGTWVNNEQIWGIYLDCRDRTYPDCHNCWSVFDAREWIP